MSWGQTILNITKRCGVIVGLAATLAGCAVHNGRSWSTPQPVKRTPTAAQLQQLPLPGDRVAVAVYNFTDQTGQFKPTDGVQTLSRAVTQGATSILVKALQEAGSHRWFTVVERERLDNLLRERAVIREMRSAYLNEKTLNPKALQPLLFAGIILEGGIIGYDTNTKSGGAGARFLGIGGSAKYREDTVTVYLRAVSVQSGEVLSSVSVRKSIASVAIDANAFRYVAFKDLLEAEAGVASNEPDALALQQAIEAAVYGLVIEGASTDLWCMASDPAASEALLRKYFARRDNVAPEQVQLVRRVDGSVISGACLPAYTTRSSALSPVTPRGPAAAPVLAQQTAPKFVQKPLVQPIAQSAERAEKTAFLPAGGSPERADPQPAPQQGGIVNQGPG